MHDRKGTNSVNRMPWEKSYNQAEVLDRAMRAFWARGYRATSMSDLVAVTGINRGSIYAGFEDKRGLFLDALRHYDRKHRHEFLETVALKHAPRDAIIAAFETAAHPPVDAPGGCLLVNTALEVSPHDAQVGAFVSDALQAVEDFFRARIEAAQAEGSIRADLSATDTASALLGLFLGLRVLMRGGPPGKDTLPALIAQARLMLD